jgi:hypothetical protein
LSVNAIYRQQWRRRSPSLLSLHFADEPAENVVAMRRKFSSFRRALAFAVAIPLQLCVAQNATSTPQGEPGVINTAHCLPIASDDPRKAPLVNVCEFAVNFLRRLPDFVCDQTTTTEGRMRTTVVKEKVQFVGGHETYSDVTINGQAELPNEYNSYVTLGARKLISAGELGSDLVDLFTPPIAADFQFRRDEKLGRFQASVFSFHLPADKNTFWLLRDSRGVSVHPEYQGEIWVDRASERVVRLSLQPTRLPYNFGFENAEITVEYEEVPITGAGTFLLPSRSETKACMRYAELRDPVCTKSKLLFHDCRKFAAKSRLVTETPVSPP